MAVSPFVIAAYDIFIAEAEPISFPKLRKSRPVEFKEISSSEFGPETYKRGLLFLGGLGGPTGNGVDYEFCSLAAGEGGVGGRGGHAGGGGGGQGGNSFDLFIVNSNNVATSYATDNRFPLADDEATQGAGGEGGNSSNTANGVGLPGNEGLSGNFGQLP